MAIGRRTGQVLIGLSILAAGCGGSPAPTPAQVPSRAPSATAGAIGTAAPAASPGVGRLPGPVVLVASRVSDASVALLLADPAGTRTPIAITGTASLGEVAARPGTREVAVVVTRCDVADQPCGTIIVAVDLATGASRDLTPYQPGANDGWPAWSPDGSQLIFTSSRNGDAFGQELYLIPAAGGAPTLLNTGLQFSQSPAWSPDGSTIAFIGQAADGTTGIELVPAGGGTPRTIVATNGSTPLAWSPDGTQIAYQAEHQVTTGANEITGYAAVAVVTVADGATTVLRATPSMNRAPAWSPDGSVIGFLAEEPGKGARLALMDPDGSNVRLVGTPDWMDQAFAWLPSP